MTKEVYTTQILFYYDQTKPDDEVNKTNSSY